MLLERRLKTHLSQAKIAEMSDISQQHYSFIESGERRSSVSVAKKIAKTLDFCWTEFFNDPKCPTPTPILP